MDLSVQVQAHSVNAKGLGIKARIELSIIHDDCSASRAGLTGSDGLVLHGVANDNKACAISLDKITVHVEIVSTRPPSTSRDTEDAVTQTHSPLLFEDPSLSPPMDFASLPSASQPVKGSPQEHNGSLWHSASQPSNTDSAYEFLFDQFGDVDTGFRNVPRRCEPFDARACRVLIDSSLRRCIAGPGIRIPRQLSMLKTPSRPSLMEISPSLFSPRYLQVSAFSLESIVLADGLRQ